MVKSVCLYSLRVHLDWWRIDAVTDKLIDREIYEMVTKTEVEEKKDSEISLH